LRRLRSAGLETVTGDLLLDDSYFDVHEPPPGEFDAQATRTYNVVPNALLMNFKAVQFQFRPDPAHNSVRVALDPPLQNLRLVNGITLGQGRCGGYQYGISFDVPAENPDRVVLDGEFSRSCRVYSMTRTVLEHDTYADGLVRVLFGEMGGRIEGRTRRAVIAQDAEPSVVWSSPSLADIVRSINKNSNNVMTRQLLYTLGAQHGGAPATRENGIAAIVQFLSDKAIDTTPLNVVNGAGLSRDSRVSARLLVDLLQAALKSPFAAEFVSSLSIGGVDGTTRGRYDSRSGGGRTHLKTGRLDHVSAIAGFAHHSDGTEYVLSVLVNTPEAHRGLGQEVEEAVLAWLFAQ
jgi:D-alanyl-D-alanine carboxypeptidase/D-alanyl-D-alanine-endopeptidase (penicillin-binding protein 4)